MNTEYKDAISDVLSGYDDGKVSSREFVYSIAWAKLHHGGEAGANECMAIRGKANSITEDFARELVVRLLKQEYYHVNGCIVEFVQSYLYGEYTAAHFIGRCIDCWHQSDRNDDRDFAWKLRGEYWNKFLDLAEVLYDGEADKLVEVAK